MNKEYRFHPVIEGLKVNEDGSEIVINHKVLPIGNYKYGSVVTVKNKVVTTMRLVCEAWHGMAETKEFVVKKVDESKGQHYSNLMWSKRGQGLNHNYSDNFCRPPLWTKEEFLEVKAQRLEGENILDFFKRCKINRKTYYIYNRKYGKKEK